MSDNVISVNNKNKLHKNKIFMGVNIILLIILLVLGFQRVYEKGLYDGMINICNELELDVGINQNEKYVCYNRTQQHNVNFTRFMNGDT